MNNIMVTATFKEENIINECGGHSRFLLGCKQIFYCGDNKSEAMKIFELLPNDDKEIFKANVNKIKIKDIEFVNYWQKIENLELL